MDISTVIDGISDVFNSYGWAGLLSVLVISGVILTVNHMIKKNAKTTVSSIDAGFKNMSDAIISQNNKLLDALSEKTKAEADTFATLLDAALDRKSKRDSDAHDASIQKRIQVSQYIKNKVHDLRNRYNADRAYLVEFHNSKQNITGLAFHWYDMVYEELSKGVVSIQDKYKDQQGTNLSEIVDAFKESEIKIYTLEDLEALQEKSSVLYCHLRVDRHVQQAITAALYDKRYRLIGILVLEYEDHQIPTEVLDIDDIKSEASAISALLDCTK